VADTPAERAAPDLTSLPADSTFGHFVRVTKLGSGGMGEVWSAWDTRLSRWVALKFLKGGSDDELARFLREARTAAALIHPHIAAVYEVGRERERPFIAMQLVEGGTLRDWPHADRRGRVALIRDAALALHFAHERGVIHRDVKPENLMFAGQRLYVMDFGLARSVDARQTASGIVVGTPAYMPPEQARGDRADARADVYSLGATLYELLTGRPPFSGATVYDILLRVIDSDPAAPRRLDPSIDTDLEAVVLRCLEKDPARRYPSAASLAADLSHWLAGEAVAARAPSTTYRARKWLSRRKALSSAVAAALLLAAGFLVYAVLSARSHAREREAAAVYADAKSELRALEMRSYRSDWSLSEVSLADFERLAARCAVQMKRTGESADGAWVAGRVRHVTGDAAGAERAYRRGIEIDRRHAECRLFLGRVLIEMALRLRFRSIQDARTKARAKALADEGARRIEEVASAGGASEIDSDIAQGYARVARGDHGTDFANAMIAKWRGRDFWEEFLVIRGLTSIDSLAADAQEALKTRPGFVEAWFWLGSAHDTEGRPQAAIDAYDACLRINPRLFEARLNRGMARQHAGDLRGAIDDFEASHRLNPDSAEVLLTLSGARLRMDDLPGAMAAIDEALRLNPGMADLYSARGAIRSRSDVRAAEADFDAALRLDPDCVNALLNRATARSLRGDTSGAADDLDRAVRADPASAEALFHRGAWRRSRGDPTGAATDLDAALGIDPKNVEALEERLRLRIELRDPRGALADADEAIQLAPKNADLLVLRSVAKEALGDIEGALSDISAGLALGGARGPLIRRRAEIERAAGDLDAALRDLDSVLRDDPRDVAALTNRAGLHVTRGDFDAAIADADAAIRTDSPPAMAYTNRGTARCSKGDTEGGMRDFEAALKINPAEPLALSNRAALRLGKGDAAGAAEDCRAALRADPDRLEAHVNLGFALARLGDPQGALEEFRRTLKLAPANWPHRKEVENCVRALEK